MTLAVPEISTPEFLARELKWMIKTAMEANPRSLQKQIGPSELGDPCTRTLLNKLFGRPERGSSNDGWLATIGTAVHAWLEAALPAINDGQFQPRFLTETVVTVGSVGGQPITGHVDLFDIDCSTVVDWKVVSASRLAMFRSKGPGLTYRRQIHLYGRGLAAAGHDVKFVMIYFLPREKDLATGWAWAEPYDESVALEALSRANGLLDLANAWGFERVIEMTPPCGVRWCHYCPRSN